MILQWDEQKFFCDHVGVSYYNMKIKNMESNQVVSLFLISLYSAESYSGLISELASLNNLKITQQETIKLSLSLEEKGYVKSFDTQDGDIKLILTQKGKIEGLKLLNERKREDAILVAHMLLKKAIEKEVFTREEFDQILKGVDSNKELKGNEGIQMRHEVIDLLSRYNLIHYFMSQKDSEEVIVKLSEFGKEIGQFEGFINHKHRVDKEKGNEKNTSNLNHKSKNDTILKVKKLIAKDMLKEAIALLIEKLDTVNSKQLVNEIVIVSGNFEDINSKERIQLINPSDLMIFKSNIRKSLLEIADKIE